MKSDRYHLDALAAALPDAQKSAPLSKWSVGKHIEHCCLAMIGIAESLAESTPPMPRAKFSVPKLFIMTTGVIPRGRGKSPEAVLPSETVDTDALPPMIEESRQAITAAEALAPDAWFEHFAFGSFTRDQTLKFLRIHNRHHLKIIEDIRRV